MGKTKLALLPDLSAVLYADMDLSIRCLATAAWLRQERLPHTARLFLALSDEHMAVAHRIAQLCGRRERAADFQGFDPPRARYASVLEAAGELSSSEEETLSALDTATSRASQVDRSLAAGTAEILLAQHRLARAANLLHDAARLHGSDPARIEHWARRVGHRFRAMLSRPQQTHSMQPHETTTPTYAASTGSY